jgi:hypothetical protein
MCMYVHEWGHVSMREKEFQVSDFYETLWESYAICGHVKAAIFNIIKSVIMADTQNGEVGTPLVPIM